MVISRDPISLRPTSLALLSVLIFSFLLMAGCSGSGEDGSNQQVATQQGGAQKGKPGAGGPGAGKGQPGGRPQQAPTPVAVAPAFTGDIASYYQATASLEAEKEARVLARASGVVGSIVAEEGDLVAEGDALLTIANPEYKYRLQQAEATTRNLKAKFERFEAMMAEELATEEEYQAARSDLANAEAEEGLARLNLSYTTVRAPFSGRVTSRLVDVGQNMSVGNEVMVMADFDPLLAKVHVPSRQFNELKQDQTVQLVLDSNAEQLDGRIKLISPVIDPTSGTIKITVEIPDYPASTRPGDFAEVSIVTELRTGSLLVPRAAVFTDKGETIAYVALRDDESGMSAERRIVTTGFTDDTNTEIISGLELGEKVVVKGQRSLKHGSAIRVLEGPGAGEENSAQKKNRPQKGDH